MAITNGYCTLAEFKLWQDVDETDTDDDGVIEDVIEGVSREIDRFVCRTFYARTETRYFDLPVPYSRTLKLDDDLISVTTLTNGDGDAISADDYYLWPRNSPPYKQIRIKQGSSEYWEQDSEGNTEAVISVEGSWGWAAAVPHDIRQACLAWARSAYQKRLGEGDTGDATITSGGVIIQPSGMPASVSKALRRYVRRL